MTGPILLVIGVIALFAAIVGGGIKFKDIEVGTVKSLWRQGLLGMFGIVVSLIGLVLVIDPNFFSDLDQSTQNTTSADPGNANAAEAAATDNSAAEQNSAGNGTQPTTDNDSDQATTG